MEILQTIWTALTTPNEMLVQLFGIPFVFIEITTSILLAITLLNIASNKKQKILYVIILSSITIVLNFYIPDPFKVLIRLFIIPLTIMIIFKTTFLKSIIAEILPMLISLIIETFFSNIYGILFNISYEDITFIPIYRESIVALIYLSMYALYRLFNKLNFNINLLNDMDKNNKFILTINFIIGIVAIFFQLYLVNSYSNILPMQMVLLTTMCLLIYFFLSIYSLIRTAKLEITTQNLEQAQLYNKSLKILHDNVRAFKHDFSNIVQAIGRLCLY